MIAWLSPYRDALYHGDEKGARAALDAVAGKAEFKEFFAQFNQANLSFMEVAEVVNCYRCELGQILEQVRTQFGTLFESVLGLVYR